MIEAAKDYLVPKRFHIVSYACVMVHFLCGSAFTVLTTVLRASEEGKFTCSVDGQSTDTYKKQVEQACFSSYDQTYNSPLSLYGFVLLSTGSAVLISLIYSLVVWKRVDEIERTKDQTQTRRTMYVFYSYFIHLVLRALFGIIFTVLQHAYFYPNGFDSKFSCYLPDPVRSSDIKTPTNVNRYGKSFTCENATASEKTILGIIVSVLNSTVAFIILAEVINLWQRFLIPNRHSEDGRGSDFKFVTVYFLGKQYNVSEYQPLRSVEENSLDGRKQECTIDHITQASIQSYKQEVKNRACPHDINYIKKISLDDMYINVIINTERAQHKFSKDMERNEIYDVYMKVPSDSIRLEKIEDLFNPGKDTKDILPRSILVTGRPGIGKTVLAEKLLHDWANEIDEFYRDKIVFFFKLRCFHRPEFQNISLKTFLQLGTRLDAEKIERIYHKIVNEPEKAIFIFDGLDECNGTPIECLDQSNMTANDLSECMSGMSLFIKLVKGEILRGATVVVTSRPTANDFYSKLDFDRNIEIIGFTSDKIKEYVSRFCKNKKRSNLKQTIWNHIKSSSELLNLCYIPVNCLIMCTTLYECLSDSENDTNVLPKTLTELYERALHYVEENHQRSTDANCNTQKTLTEKLQQVAFNGMEDGKLVFEHEQVDEQMKASGLLNNLSESTVSPDQFCFTHFTLQEFLAARHVTETFTFAEIKTFISDRIKLPKWHLVLQFISGFLSKKINKFPRESKDCISAFVEGLEAVPDQYNSDHKRAFLNHHEVLVMKCLREVNNEEIVKDVCETTVLNDVVELCSQYDLSSGEWAAVTAVCKHMSNLAILELEYRNRDSLRSVQKFLEKRCIMKLELTAVPAQEGMDNVFSTLMDVSCTLKDRHTCTKLTSLKLVCIHTTDERLTNICKFFENGHGSHLEILDLRHNKFSRMSKLLEMSKSECCPKLAHLCLFGNAIYDEDAQLLWDALTKGLRKLTTLDVSNCRLTNQCIPSLCKALQDGRCQLTVLSLNSNDIGDKGAGTLFETAFTKENCKLTKLRLCHCSLTDRCVRALHKAQKDQRRSIDLDLNGNFFTEKGKRVKKVALNPKDHKKYLAEINW